MMEVAIVLTAILGALVTALVLHARLSVLISDMEIKHRMAQDLVRSTAADSTAVYSDASKLSAKIEATRSFLRDELDKAQIKVDLGQNR